MADESLKKKTLTGLFWAFAERMGAKGVSFIVSIILARLLMPEEYGIIAIVTVFIDVCDVFVGSGFGKALIQKKDTDELDVSSVFCFSLCIALILYAVLFLAAPFIGAFYRMDILVPMTRVMGVRLIIGAFLTVQKALVSRKMQFKMFFYATLIGTVISALVGICMAYAGFGVWALVGQYLSNSAIDALMLTFQLRWKPSLRFSWSRMKPMVSYGGKALVGTVMDTLYKSFTKLYIGKLYTADDLGFYSRGDQFPKLLVGNINASISGVLFPAMSSEQDDVKRLKGMTRRAVKTSSFLLCPMLFGLTAVAEPLVLFLLTEKWLPCVPFLQIISLNYVMEPMQTANLEAIYAMGRVDIALKLNVIKKIIGIILILISARISIIALALSGILSSVISLILNIYPNKQLMEYGYLDQLRDILPYWGMSAAMFFVVRLVSILSLPVPVELVVMILVGIISYVGMSMLFRVESFFYILNTMKKFLTRKKK